MKQLDLACIVAGCCGRILAGSEQEKASLMSTEASRGLSRLPDARDQQARGMWSLVSLAFALGSPRLWGKNTPVKRGWAASEAHSSWKILYPAGACTSYKVEIMTNRKREQTLLKYNRLEVI